jgi:hypothetical protein
VRNDSHRERKKGGEDGALDAFHGIVGIDWLGGGRSQLRNRVRDVLNGTMQSM